MKYYTIRFLIYVNIIGNFNFNLLNYAENCIAIFLKVPTRWNFVWGKCEVSTYHCTLSGQSRLHRQKKVDELSNKQTMWTIT